MNAKSFIDKELVLALDGILYSIKMAKYSYSCTQNAMTEAEDAFRALAGIKEEHAVKVFMYIWSFIDSVHRSRELITSVRGLKKNDFNIKLFKVSTEKVRYFRNYVQHFRSDLKKIATYSTPLWGSLSWVSRHDPKSCILIHAGTPTGDKGVKSCTYDTVNQSFVSSIILYIDNYFLVIDEIYEKLLLLEQEIESFCQNRGNRSAVKSVSSS